MQSPFLICPEQKSLVGIQQTVFQTFAQCIEARTCCHGVQWGVARLAGGIEIFQELLEVCAVI